MAPGRPLTPEQAARAAAHGDLIAPVARAVRPPGLDRDERTSAAGLGLAEAAADPRAPRDDAGFRTFARRRMRWRILRDARAARAWHAAQRRAPPGPGTTGPDAGIEARDLAEAARGHLPSLGPRQRTAILLSLDGLGMAEIAAAMGVSEATAYGYCRAAARALRSALT